MSNQAKLVSRNWRTAFFLLLAVFVLTIGVLIYKIIDQAVTITYMQEGYHDTEKDLLTLSRLTPALRQGMTKKDILFLLRQQNSNEIITEEGQLLNIGQLQFIFDRDNRLIEIKRK
jgi:hypothetical protein